MYAVEFRAKIKDSMIQIPEELRSRLGDQVRVILLTEEKEPVDNFIDELLENPLQAKEFIPLSREEAHERR